MERKNEACVTERSEASDTMHAEIVFGTPQPKVVAADFEVSVGRARQEEAERAEELRKTNRAIQAALEQQKADAKEQAADAMERPTKAVRRAGLSQPPMQIELMPGSSALQWLTWIYSRKTIERVFQPVVADSQQEYVDALGSGRTGFAWWLGKRCYIHLLLSMVHLAWNSAARALIGFLIGKAG